MVVTFFGHREVRENIDSILRQTIVDLIENHNADVFYVGNQGHFDFTVRKTLKMLSAEYPHIRYAVMLAYLPWNQNDLYPEDFSDAIFPEELETVPKRFAIDKRNHLMLSYADTVVTYVKRTDGGAAKFQTLAKKKGKTVINIADLSKCQGSPCQGSCQRTLTEG